MIAKLQQAYARARHGIVLGALVAGALCLPHAAFAQASITGIVRDTSGAVLPGVTVEASSPALIEKVRSSVTDGSGQYRIENLRPGPYSVRFTLAGFNAVAREGIELTGSLTATVSVELRVGSVEETITVTGETPVVDLQRAQRADRPHQRRHQVDSDRRQLQLAARARPRHLRRAAGRQHRPLQLVHVQRAWDAALGRPRQQRGPAARRGHQHRRAAGRRHQLPHGHPQRTGSVVHDVGQPRRSGVGRSGDEHRAALRRQHPVG